MPRISAGGPSGNSASQQPAAEASVDGLRNASADTAQGQAASQNRASGQGPDAGQGR